MAMYRLLTFWFLCVLLAAGGAFAQPSSGFGPQPGPASSIVPGTGLSAGNVTATGGGTQSLASWMLPEITLQSVGGICDGSLHPLSNVYSSLGAAQAAFPNAGITSTAQQIDWAAMQQAIYNATNNAITHKVKLLGVCRMGSSSTTFCTNWFLLQGDRNSTLTYDGTTGNVLQTCGTSRLQSPTLRDFTINYTATQSSGYGISLDNTYFGTLENLLIYGDSSNIYAWQGLFLGRSDTTSLNSVQIQYTNRECMVMTGTDNASGVVSEVHFNKNTIFHDCNTGLANRTAALTAGAVRVDDHVQALFFNPTTEIYHNNGYSVYFNGALSADNYNAYFNGFQFEECISWCGGIGGNHFKVIQITGGQLLATDMDAINLGADVTQVVIGGGALIGASPGVTASATNPMTFDGSELQIGDAQLQGGAGAGTNGVGLYLGTDSDYIYLNGTHIWSMATGVEAATTSGKHYIMNGMTFRANTADFGTNMLAANNITGSVSGYTGSFCNLFATAAATMAVSPCGTSILNVTGTTAINHITGGTMGETITLNLQSSGATVKNQGTGGNIVTLSRSDYAPAHAFVISTYFYDGAYWWQTSAGN